MDQLITTHRKTCAGNLIGSDAGKAMPGVEQRHGEERKSAAHGSPTTAVDGGVGAREHGSRLLLGLALAPAKPLGAQLFQLVKSERRNVFTPLRDCRWRNAKCRGNGLPSSSVLKDFGESHAMTLAHLTPRSSAVDAPGDGIAGQMTTLAERLKELKETTGLTDARIAEVCGITASAVSQWGKPGAKMKGENAIFLEEVTPYKARWIMEGKGPKFKGGSLDIHHAGPLQSGTKLPVRRSYTPIGGMGKMQPVTHADPTSTGGFVEAVVTASEAAYGIRIRGDGFEPVLSDGWTVVLDPNAQHQPGEWVYLELETGEEMLVRYLYARGDMVELQTLDKKTSFTMAKKEIASIIAVIGTAPPSKWRQS